MNNINWDELRYFFAAAEAGSLSAAAKQLNSKQPTVTRHIDALETMLGVKLFERSVKGIKLTKEGQAVFEQAEKISHAVTKIQRVAQGIDNHAAGTVRLSLPEGLGQEVLIPALDEFYKAYPEIKLIFNVSATTANLTQGKSDIAVRLFQPEESNLVVTHLGDMQLGLYASKKYEKDYGLPKRLKDLRQHKVITYGDHLSILPENQWLLNHTEESLRILYSDSTVTRFKAGVAGIGISIQPEILAQTNKNLVRVFKAANLPTHNVWMVYHEDLQHITRIRVVIDFISNYLTKSLV